MRHLDAPRFHAIGAGEGSFFVAEEFAFQQRAGNRWAIHLHPWSGLPRRSGVDHARDNVFAGAALSLDEHRDVGAGYLSQPFAQGPHGFGAPEDDRLGRHLAEGLNQGTDWI